MGDKGRWFLIEHKECGSVVTVNSHKFLEAVNTDDFDESEPLKCPTCFTTFHKKDNLRGFFEEYELLTKTLGRSGFKIREIKTRIDSQDLNEKSGS